MDLNPVDFYLYAATSQNEAVNYRALRLLGQLHDTTAFYPLLNIFENDTSKWRRRSATYALGDIRDPRAIDILVGALNNDDFEIRNNAGKTVFNTLIELQDPRAYDIIIAALNEKYSTIRGYAVTALGKMDDQRVIEPLIGALNDKNYAVVNNAIVALTDKGDKRAIEPLVRLINTVDNKKTWGGQNRKKVLNSIIKALGDFGDPVAIEPIIPLLKIKILKPNAVVALNKLTGVDNGEKYKDWLKWWNQNKSKYLN